jgi:sulfite exporter TauE/SafE
MEGFLLGIGSGATCLAFCAPVLVPGMLGGRNTIPANLILLMKFLSGRFIGYLLFALLGWSAQALLFGGTPSNPVFYGIIQLILALALAFYSIRDRESGCLGTSRVIRKSGILFTNPALMPVLFGFLTGVSICPPLLLAFTKASATGSLAGSLWVFGWFFVGTIPYVIPLTLLGVVPRKDTMRSIGRMAGILVAGYYFYNAIILIGGGMV